MPGMTCSDISDLLFVMPLFFFVAQTVFDLITRDRENYLLSFFSMCEMGFLLNFFFSFVISANLQKSTGVLIGHLFLFYS